MTCNCCVCKVAWALVLIGAINWGLVGIFNVNLVAMIFGDMTTGARIVYGLVGVAGVIKLVTCFKACPVGKSSGTGCC